MADLTKLWSQLQHQSLLKKNLTVDLYNELKDKKTKYGGTLADCIRSGARNPQSNVGIYASDPEAYTTFSKILDKVIKDYHKVDKLTHPDPNFGDLDNLGFSDLDPSGKMIVSTRVRVGRSHKGFGFPPTLTKADRLKMEEITKEALNKLKGPLKGTYYPLVGMDKQTEKQLINDHFLFKDDDKCLKDASGYDDWPVGRGIFHNANKTFLVWVNEEDHLRFISMQMGGDLGEVYTRLVKAINAMQLEFERKEGLGYLTFCPTNLGTTLRASVHIKIPNLAATSTFNEFCEKHNIQARGIHGEHTESVGGVYDISNKRRLGLTEIEAIHEMRKGVEAVMKEEKKLAGQKK
ncbi:arginine kinase-like isoform X2 [Babylonia areolata]|uniref:arginine kinase-like isoform X2 n=1 Tax=Babylonia areolata TaxID=304850 RepID=UPI003FCF8EE1